MFGGHVRAGIDSRWCSHVSIPKTAMQLLGLPPIGVARLDDDPGLGDVVDCAMAPTPPPPAYRTNVNLPAALNPTPPQQPLPPPPAQTRSSAAGTHVLIVGCRGICR
jgi:hypothetical protein